MEENNQNPNTLPVESSPIEQNNAAPVQKKFKLPIAIAGIVLLLVIGTASAVFLLVSKPKQAVCTVEVKICPDGSSVGRTGPNCEFSPCPTPTQDPTTNWKTYTNSQFGFSLKYPPSVTTGFVVFDGGAGGNNLLGLKGPNYKENTDFGSGMAIWASNIAGSDPKTATVIDRQSIKQNEAAGFGQNFDLSCAVKETKIGNSASALLQTCNKVPAQFIYVQNSKGIITRLTTLSAGNYQPLIDQILSTFTFAPSD